MAYLYPWGNSQELNLEWIIQKIKDLENGAAGADIEEIANVLVALTYRSANTYQQYDYAFYNGKLYRATVNTTGVFNPSDWLEVQIGNDVAILTRLVENLDTDDINNASNVTGATASDALNNLNSALTASNILKLPSQTLSNIDLNSILTDGTYIIDASCTNAPPTLAAGKLIVMHTGDNNYTRHIYICGYDPKVYTRSRYYDLNNGWSWTTWEEWTNSALVTKTNQIQNQITANIETSNTATRGYIKNDYLVLNGLLYRVTTTIQSGETLTPNTNIVATNIGNDMGFPKLYIHGDNSPGTVVGTTKLINTGVICNWNCEYFCILKVHVSQAGILKININDAPVFNMNVALDQDAIQFTVRALSQNTEIQVQYLGTSTANISSYYLSVFPTYSYSV